MQLGVTSRYTDGAATGTFTHTGPISGVRVGVGRGHMASIAELRSKTPYTENTAQVLRRCQYSSRTRVVSNCSSSYLICERRVPR